MKEDTRMHFSKPGSLEPDDDGWFHARCDCGKFEQGPLPDAETAADALMQHAREQGYIEGLEGSPA